MSTEIPKYVLVRFTCDNTAYICKWVVTRENQKFIRNSPILINWPSPSGGEQHDGQVVMMTGTAKKPLNEYLKRCIKRQTYVTTEEEEDSSNSCGARSSDGDQFPPPVDNVVKEPQRKIKKLTKWVPYLFSPWLQCRYS
jgi:hypothetical protein